MKFTLKNRPIVLTSEIEYFQFLSKAELGAVNKKMTEILSWFEGFEKELREKYEEVMDTYTTPRSLIKEILGE